MTTKWPEILAAIEKQKKDLKLSGAAISKQVEEASGVIDPTLWTLVALTKLEISSVANIGLLQKNLKELILSDNKISQLPEEIGSLQDLKTLILQNNQLTEIPKSLCKLKNLQVLNVSQNKLASLPDNFGELSGLITLNLSFNSISTLPKQISKLGRLATLIMSHCLINNITDANFESMVALQTLDLSSNKLIETPVEIGLCNKLKDLNLLNNPFKDKKFIKLLESGKVKSVIQQLQKSAPTKKKEDKEEEEDLEDLKIQVEFQDEPECVIVQPTQTFRPYLCMAIIKGIEFTESSYKLFIDIQTDIHQTIGKKRTVATIGTHDYKSVKGPFYYEGKAPKDIKFVPLKEDKPFTGIELVKHFEKQNDQAMIKYMGMIKSNPLWPVLIDSSGEILSLPPVINSKYSQVSLQSTDILLEVTSSTSLAICKEVMGVLLQRISKLIPFEQKLVVQQVKVLGDNGHVRIQYPTLKDIQEVCSGLN